MKTRWLLIAMMLAMNIGASSSNAAVQATGVAYPTLASFIGMGSTPIAIGPFEFSDFSFVDTSSGETFTPDQIQVEPSSIRGFGLQFVADWSAADGSSVDEEISYTVTATSPVHPIGEIDLLSNGNAPSPGEGTFTAATLASSLLNGRPAARTLSNFNDGAGYPTGEQTNINYDITTLVPQNSLRILDTLYLNSAPATGTTGGGVATESDLQNSFVTATVSVPEFHRTGLIFWMLVAGLLPWAVIGVWAI